MVIGQILTARVLVIDRTRSLLTGDKFAVIGVRLRGCDGIIVLTSYSLLHLTGLALIQM